MLNSKTFDEISSAVNSVLPKELQQSVEKNIRAALRSALEKLDLVTREELEVQEAVLLRTRKKLQELESKIAELEAKVK